MPSLQVGGLSTNAGFLQRLAMHPAFVAADLDTGFIPKHLEALTVPQQPSAESLALAALAFHHFGIQHQVTLSADWRKFATTVCAVSVSFGSCV